MKAKPYSANDKPIESLSHDTLKPLAIHIAIYYKAMTILLCIFD